MSDGIWITVAQVASVIGALLTVRVLTEVLTPEQFGFLALFLGAVTLAQSLFCTPILQGLLRHYADFSAQGRLPELCSTARRIVIRRATFLSALGIVGGAIGTAWHIPVRTTILLSIFLFLEMWRSYQTTLLNPTRQVRAFATVAIAEGLGRPLLALGFAGALGFSIDAVLVAYLATSLISAGLATALGEKKVNQNIAVRVSSEAAQRLSTFSVPLMPLAIVNWCNGTIDRYIIAAFLGTGSAGIYAASYGLISRPFVMAAHVIELTLRPIYYEATSNRDTRLAQETFDLWVTLVIIAAVSGYLVVYFFAEVLADIFLGSEFREGATTMRWLAAGYGVLAVSQALAKKFYALYQTRRILLVETAGLLVALLALPMLLQCAGIVGAAVAVLVGAVAQILIAARFLLYEKRRVAL